MALFGIYSVVSFTLAHRTHEIAIRGALGARESDITRLFVGRGLRPVVVGLAVGVFGALALSQLLESLLYEVDPQDPCILAVAVLIPLVGAVAVLAIPASLAATKSPAVALRES